MPLIYGSILFFIALLSGCSSSTTPQLRRESNSSCRPLTLADRLKLVSLASPKRYTGAKYRMGPRTPQSIEKETDCSRFVHEIYRRAGLPYSYRPTASLGDAPEFDVLEESEAKPGDIMLFRGHAGLVDREGKIISATLVRSRKQKSTITRMDRRNFKGFKGKFYVLRYRCRPYIERSHASSGLK